MEVLAHGLQVVHTFFIYVDTFCSLSLSLHNHSALDYGASVGCTSSCLELHESGFFQSWALPHFLELQMISLLFLAGKHIGMGYDVVSLLQQGGT